MGIVELQLEHEIARCRDERMKNGDQYRQSIHQQIIDLLKKARLVNEQQVILHQLDSRKID